MKNNYFKSTGLILLGGILAIIGHSFLSNHKSTNSFTCNDGYIDGCEKFERPNDRRICIKKAQQDVAAYQMWLKFLPKYLELEPIKDSIRVKYHNRSFPSSEWETLKRFYDLAVKNNPKDSITMKNIPFYAVLNNSFYISKDDIDEAFCSFKEATGINVYLGLRGRNEMKMSSIESHLLVLPALKDTIAKTLHDQPINYGGKEYALDLTDPCPKLCATSSDLYRPILK